MSICTLHWNNNQNTIGPGTLGYSLLSLKHCNKLDFRFSASLANLSSFDLFHCVLYFLHRCFLSCNSILFHRLLFFTTECNLSLRFPCWIFKAFNSQLLLTDSSLPHVVSVRCQPHNSNSGELQYYAPQVGVIFSFLGVINPFTKTRSTFKTGLRSKLFLKSCHLGDTRVASERDCDGKNARSDEIRSSLVCRQLLLSSTGLSRSAELYTVHSCSPFIVHGFGRDD